VWDQFITKTTYYESYAEQKKAWSEEQRKGIQNKLVALREFMEESKGILYNLHINNKPIRLIESLNYRTNNEELEIIIKRERNQIDTLRVLIERLIQALEILIFMDDQEIFRELQMSLTSETQGALAETRFKQIVCQSNTDVFFSELVIAFINLKKEKGVDSFKLALDIHQKCPLYFTKEYFDVYEAELLLERAAMGPENRILQVKLIKDAMEIIMRNLRRVNMQKILPILLSLEEFHWIMKVCLTDLKDLLKENEQGNNETQIPEPNKKAAYSYVIELLDSIHSTIIYRSIGRKSSTKKLHGAFQNFSDDELFDLEDSLIDEAINISKDEVFHLTLFRWLCDNNSVDKLMRLDSPYLAEFMKNRFNEPEPVEITYKYYAGKKQYKKAMESLYKLATSPSDINDDHFIALDDRINYLNRAINYIDQSENEHEITKSEAEKYKEMLEKCKDDIGLQKLTLEYMKKRTEDIEELEQRLYDSKELYNNFAKKYDLWEIIIKIYNKEGNIPIENAYKKLLWQVFNKDRSKWPKSSIKKLVSLVTEPNELVLEEIIREGEEINMECFQSDKVADDIEEYIEMEEYWIIKFFCENHLKIEFEKIYDLYSKVENDSKSVCYTLRIEISKMVCCILWAISIKDEKYSEDLIMNCKEAVRDTIKKTKVLHFN